MSGTNYSLISTSRTRQERLEQPFIGGGTFGVSFGGIQH